MSKYIGTKNFYKAVLSLSFPVLIQNAITTFVSMLDNIMVGAVGTYQMSGVSIANQLIFVFNLFVFGAVSAAGIFSAQFYGDKNFTGVKYSFRYKLYACLTVTVLAIVLFLTCGSFLLKLYLTGSEDAVNEVLHYGINYLKIMLVGLIPFAVSQTYSSTLRETDQTVMPMVAGVIAVLVNLLFNWIFIFGKLGAPAMGASGAALATVISRFVEAAIIICWTHKNHEKNLFIKGVYKSFKIPKNIVKSITIKGTPLVLNEGLWAASVATLLQCYSVRGIDVVAALNINSTIANVFNIIFLSLGTATSIRMGQLLGANKKAQAKTESYQLLAFSVVVSSVFGIIMASLSGFFPLLYDTEQSVRDIATSFIFVTALFMPVQAYLNSAYFTIRSGGKTGITFLFDNGFAWIISVPVAFIFARYSSLSIIWVYFIVQSVEFIKAFIGYLMVKSDIWIHNIVSDKN